MEPKIEKETMSVPDKKIDPDLDDAVAKLVDDYLQEQVATNNLRLKNRGRRFERLLNNKYINIIFVLILVTLLVWMFTKVAYLFTPLVAFVQIVSMPIIFAAVMYYLTVPLVNRWERHGLKRVRGTVIVLVIIILIIGALGSLIPIILGQGRDFARDWTSIWSAYKVRADSWIGVGGYREIQKIIEEGWSSLKNLDAFNLTALANSTLASLGMIVGTLTRVIVALVTAPIILFYMLRDGQKLPDFLLGFVPGRIRQGTFELFGRMNTQVSQYIRGQILVAVAVAVMFVIGYIIIGLPYGIIIGVVAGLLNVIPYLGSFIGLIPALIVGIVVSPVMLLQVLVVFAIEQAIESRVISPLILGGNLNIHPVTIMLLLFAGADLFGFVGLILIIPVYAVLKVVVSHFFEWYREVSGLYDDDDEYEPVSRQSETVGEPYMKDDETAGLDGAKIDEQYHQRQNKDQQ